MSHGEMPGEWSRAEGQHSGRVSGAVRGGEAPGLGWMHTGRYMAMRPSWSLEAAPGNNAGERRAGVGPAGPPLPTHLCPSHPSLSPPQPPLLTAFHRPPCSFPLGLPVRLLGQGSWSFLSRRLASGPLE